MTGPLVKYFPELTPIQLEQFNRMGELYRHWNERINVISRKDISRFETHHLLHSLSIAKAVPIRPGALVLDAGTGGGFPGLPLAVFFPEVHFTLVDSIGKKIRVIETIADELELDNVTAVNARFETIRGSFDYVTGRAVSSLPLFFGMVKGLVNRPGYGDAPNGILYLTGGDIEAGLAQIRSGFSVRNLSDFFEEAFFVTKKLVHLHSF